ATRQFGDPLPDVAEAAAQGAASVDPAARQAAYAAANNALRQAAPMAPLAHGGWISPYSLAAAFHKELQGAHASPLGLEDFATLAGLPRLVWIQAAEPSTLYCGLAGDIETLRACAQLAGTLYRFKPGTVEVEPDLAQACTPDDSLAVWTCTLQPGALFHDGSAVDAGDVAGSFIAQWQAASPLHRLLEAQSAGGRFGPADLVYFEQFWGAFLP
ncbi:MAG: peptide ABC transporter substrate-binding protein, partial [Chloroflexota bacterium]